MKLYTAKELAKILKVNSATIYRLGQQGKIERYKVGTCVRFPIPPVDGIEKTDTRKDCN